MKQVKALQTLQASGKKIFTSADLQKILQTDSDGYSYILAGRLVKAGILERVLRGVYTLAADRPSDFELSNALCRPSYVSLESALNYYGILIQSPQQVTAVTTQATEAIQGGGNFTYSHLDRKYFTGYQVVNGFLIATPEKALIDTMYFVALGKAALSIEELSLDLVDKKKVSELAATIENRAFKNYYKTVNL